MALVNLIDRLYKLVLAIRTDVRALQAAQSLGYVKVKRTTTQSIANNTHQQVSFDTVFESTLGSTWSSGSPTRITVPAEATSCKLSAYIFWTPNATGLRLTRLLKNGSVIPHTILMQQAVSVASVETSQLTAADRVPCVAGDYFELGALQSSGAALNLSITSGQYAMLCVEFFK